MLKIFKTDKQIATEASYKVCYLIAVTGEAHLIGESFIKPCIKYIVWCVFGEEYVKAVSLFNTTVSRRINNIADDIKRELISRLCACDAYALQLDE